MRWMAFAIGLDANRAKALGFSLEEVREILSLRRQGTEPCVCVRQMIARNLALIE